MKNTTRFVNDDSIVSGKSLVQIVEEATALLGDANRWCGGAPAIDRRRRITKVNSPTAVAWSIEGAIGKVSNDLGVIPPSVLHFLDAVLVKFPRGEWEDLGKFNDTVVYGVMIEFLLFAREEAINGNVFQLG